MIADILFAIGLALFACAVCWVGVVYRSTRRTIRCRCGRTVRRVSLINFPDIARYSLMLTDECPGCHALSSVGWSSTHQNCEGGMMNAEEKLLKAAKHVLAWLASRHKDTPSELDVPAMRRFRAAITEVEAEQAGDASQCYKEKGYAVLPANTKYIPEPTPVF